MSKQYHPQRGRQIQVGLVKIGDFRPIISDMVQDRDTVTTED